MKTYSKLFIFFIGMLVFSNMGLCQSWSASLTRKVCTSNKAFIYRDANIDTSIIRVWKQDNDPDKVFQLIYVRCDINKCNRSLGYFRKIPVNNTANHWGESEYEIPVDFYVTDIEVLDNFAYFCGTLYNGDEIYGVLNWEEHEDPIMWIIRPHNIYVLSPDQPQNIYAYQPKKIAVHAYSGSSDYTHFIAVGDMVNKTEGYTETYAAEFAIKLSDLLGNTSSANFNFTRRNSVQIIPTSSTSLSLTCPIGGRETMSYEDVVITEKDILLIGHVKKIDNSPVRADLAIERFQKLDDHNNYTNFSLNGTPQRVRINSCNLFYYNLANNEFIPISRALGTYLGKEDGNDVILIGTGIHCKNVNGGQGGEQYTIGLDMLKINSNGIERLGQTTILKGKLVDLKAVVDKEMTTIQPTSVCSDTTRRTINKNNVAILIDVDPNNSQVITLKGLYRYVGSSSTIDKCNITSIDIPFGDMFDLGRTYTSLDVVQQENSDKYYYFFAASNGSKFPKENSQDPIEIYQQLIHCDCTTSCGHDCLTNQYCKPKDRVVNSLWPQNDCVKPLYFCSLHSSNAIAAGTTELLPIGSNKDNYISGKKVACILDSLTSELICNKEEYGEGPKNSSKNVSNDYEQKDDDVLIKERITIFPNPTHDLIHITSNSTIKMIEIFDVNGALLMNKSCTLNSTSIGTHSLSSGIYYIRIVDDLGIVTKIFCKE